MKNETICVQVCSKNLQSPEINGANIVIISGSDKYIIAYVSRNKLKTAG